jgi:hypothetical protein
MKHMKALAELVIGVKQMRKSMGLLSVFLVALVALILGAAALQGCNDDGAQAQGNEIPFDDAQIFFEFNSTDLDLGIQIFLDADGWVEVEVTGPDGRIFRVENDGSLSVIGSTELFTESEEPELDENNLEESIAEFLAMFPEGDYTFSGTTVGGDELVGTAELTHNLPDPVDLDVEGFPFVEWTPGLDGPAIVGYEVVAEMVVEDPEERVFVNTATLPATVQSFTFSPEFDALADAFLASGELVELKVEVIAMEESGNRTITEEIIFEVE